MQSTETHKLVCELTIISNCPWYNVVTLSHVRDISTLLWWNNWQQCPFP